MHRRTAVAVALAALLATSGCLGVLTGGGVEVSASQATVSEDALQETGYQEVSVDESVVTREFSAAGQSRNVTVTNWVAMYERSIDVPFLGEQRAAVFGAFASPEVSVLGQSFNPIEDYDNRDLAGLAQQQYDGLSVGESVGTREATVLNETTEVTKFEGTADIDGQTVDVYIHVTKVKHDGDHVVAVAIYPQALDGEEDRVDELLAGLEH
ncbi:DUF6517 family protein [Halobacterium hubeiense]|uniref:DUF6517 family protein n=1 Tax=Halobacterium hubeiense TaxID=1407499 RepID=UPI003C74E927